MELFDVIEKLTRGGGVSGDEYGFSAASELLSEYCDVNRSPLGSVWGSVGSGKIHILLDAHLDRIGLTVTAVDESGFLRVDKCGGVDARVLSAAEVTVFGKEKLYGVVTSVPPHLTKDGDSSKAPDFDNLYIDLGLPYEKAKKLVKPGDRITVDSPLKKLCGDVITGAALDDRIGVAAILRVLELIKDKNADARVTALFSVQEETTEAGGRTGAFALEPDEAIAVDVSFAAAPGIAPTDCGTMEKGGMICVSPSLSKEMSDRLIALSEEKGIPYQIEVCPGASGTNADVIASSKSGVKTGLVSIPLRNMHTQAEVASLYDIESVAQIIAAYILGIGGEENE